MDEMIHLTSRTPEFIGRQEILERIRKYLFARGERHYLYIYAEGGLGKTRILQKVQEMVREAGPGFAATEIIDLYHTQMHSTSEIERAIINGLDPQKQVFKRYREERASYERLRERGGNPELLESKRKGLSEIFVEECRRYSEDVKKIVILFDTIELLQSETSQVEEIAGIETMDARVRPWLLKKLSDMRNVLVIFAGRPQRRGEKEGEERHTRMEREMQGYFKEDFLSYKLEPLNHDEARALIHTVLVKNGAGPDILSEDMIPVINCLTGGQPILIHLVLDLLLTLHTEPKALLDLFEKNRSLTELAPTDQRLEEARHELQKEIVQNLFNAGGELGAFLQEFAFMPKGVDIEILVKVMGMSLKDAHALIEQLQQLTFVKFIEDTGLPERNQKRVFLHDEAVYLFSQYQRSEKELQRARQMVQHYYNPAIGELEQFMMLPADDTTRVRQRMQLQRLQADRLYYRLISDPAEGYAEYKFLTSRANADRFVGFSMRLLDEFLRFFNISARREMLARAGIPYEQVIRESVQMWAERRHWWGQYAQALDFCEEIQKHPEKYCITEQDIDVLANVSAIHLRASAMTRGYMASLIEPAKALLEKIPDHEQSTPNQTLALGRLATSIGYQYRWGGLLDEAANYNTRAIAAFRRLRAYPEELVIVLNNQCFVYGKMGQSHMARMLGDEALNTRLDTSNEYSRGLAYTNLASVERMGGNDFERAKRYAETALNMFQKMEDSHGIIRALLNLGGAKRLIARRSIPALDSYLQEKMLFEARSYIQEAKALAKNELLAEMKGLLAEEGKIVRSLAHLAREQKEIGKANDRLQEARLLFEESLKGDWSIYESADIVQDLAEVVFEQGDWNLAREKLQSIEKQINVNGILQSGAKVPCWFYLPLGKMERTYAMMEYSVGHVDAAMQHILLAAANFMRFSDEPLERDKLIELVYKNILQKLELFSDRKNALLNASTWLEMNQSLFQNVNLQPFLDKLYTLTGIHQKPHDIQS